VIPDATDVPALAEALSAMLADTKMRECWGANAHHRVAQHFTVLHALTAWLDLLPRADRSAA